MKLASPHLEKRLRQVVTREVRQSPSRYREWKRRRWVAWQWRIAGALRRQVAVLSVVAAVPIVALWLVLIAESNLAGLPDGQPGPPTGSDFLLGLQSVLVIGLASWIAATYDRSYVAIDGECVYACLPVDDHHFVRMGSWREWFSAVLLSIIAVIPMAMIALRENLGGLRLAAAVALIVLTWLLTLACGLLAAAYSPSKRKWRGWLWIVGVSLFFGGMIVGPWSFGLSRRFADAVAACWSITPPGWVAAAYFQGLLQGNHLAWERVRTRFALREFKILPDRRWIGVLQRGFRVPEIPGDLPAARPSQEPLLERVVLTHEEAAVRVASGEYLQPLGAERSGFVQRTAARLLSRRHLAIVESWSRTYAGSTFTWRGVCVGIPIVLGCLWVFRPNDDPGVGTLLMFGFILVYGGWSTDAWPKTRFIANLPVTLGEVFRAVLWLDVVRSIYWLPILLVYGAAGAWIIAAPVSHGVLAGLYLGGIRLILEASHVCGGVALVTCNSNRLPASILAVAWMHLYGFLFGALFCSFYMQDFPAGFWAAIVSVTLLAPLLLSWLQVRLYYRGKLDLVADDRSTRLESRLASR